jgi:hypothetical protein
VISVVSDNANDALASTDTIRYGAVHQNNRTGAGLTKGPITPAGAVTPNWSGFTDQWSEVNVAVAHQ